MEVAMSVASFDVTSVADLQRQQLASANVQVYSAKCFASNGTGGMIVIGPSKLLYVYEIPADDAEKASAIGFKTGFSREGYFSTAVPCETPPDIPAL